MTGDELCYVEDILLFRKQCSKYRTDAFYFVPATSRQDLFRLTLLCVECKARNIFKLCVFVYKSN